MRQCHCGCHIFREKLGVITFVPPLLEYCLNLSQMVPHISHQMCGLWHEDKMDRIIST